MAYNTTPQGLAEIFCTACGRSIGFHPYQGFKTVSECGMCNQPDGFDPPPEWPLQDQFLGHSVGNTIEKLAKHGRQMNKPGQEEKPSAKPPKKRRTWMNMTTKSEEPTD